MSRKRDQIMGHAAENDGIEEYDNPLPDWWTGMFIFSILFAIGYTVEYHFISDRSQEAAYEAQLAEAKVRWPDADRVATVSTDPADIIEGEAIYAQNCASCHGAQLEGKIGPSLVDKVWIHGGTPEEMVQTITKGVPEKGMLAWGPVLGPARISKVASFVHSKGGTLAPGEASEAPADPVIAMGGSADPAEAPKPEGPELPAFAATDISPDMVQAGQALYKTNCASCHKEDMTGLVGPSLVDEEWLHGGDVGDIYRTVTYGVPAKGMVSWEPILGDEKIRQVVAYVYSKSHEDADQP